MEDRAAPNGFDTDLQHFAEDDLPFRAVVPPIVQSSLFSFKSWDEFATSGALNPAGPPYHYSRTANPTLDVVERKLARLERMDRAKVFASGMAAISAAILSCVEPGKHVVAVESCYGPVRTFLTDYLAKFGVASTFVDGRESHNILDAIQPETTVVYLESPSSVVFRLQDIQAVTKVCREKGITTIKDNSYSTPVFQTPAEFGVDMVVHSATKYLAGHSDMTAGVVTMGEAKFDRFIREEVSWLGASLGPFQAWLLLRALRTLSIRLKHHEKTANTVAAWLCEQREVDHVIHVGLPCYPQRALFHKQMRGSGGLFTFRPARQNLEWAKTFVESLGIFKMGVSWGGFESLAVMMPPQAFTDPNLGFLVRLYCGLEDAGDLIADLRQAFDRANLAG